MSSASTTMPGLVISLRLPPRTSAVMRSSGWVITASVKSSVTLPPRTVTSSSFGTTQRPSRRTLLPRTSMRTSSFGVALTAPGPGGATTAPAVAGRSAVSAASSA